MQMRKNPLFSLIRIRFGSCEVRRLKWALEVDESVRVLDNIEGNVCISVRFLRIGLLSKLLISRHHFPTPPGFNRRRGRRTTLRQTLYYTTLPSSQHENSSSGRAD